MPLNRYNSNGNGQKLSVRRGASGAPVNVKESSPESSSMDYPSSRLSSSLSRLSLHSSEALDDCPWSTPVVPPLNLDTIIWMRDMRENVELWHEYRYDDLASDTDDDYDDIVWHQCMSDSQRVSETAIADLGGDQRLTADLEEATRLEATATVAVAARKCPGLICRLPCLTALEGLLPASNAQEDYNFEIEEVVFIESRRSQRMKELDEALQQVEIRGYPSARVRGEVGQRLAPSGAAVRSPENGGLTTEAAARS